MKKRTNGVFVIAEMRNQVIEPVSYELLGKGRELANLINKDLGVCVVGDLVSDEICNSLISFGADFVVKVQNEKLKYYTTEPFTAATTEIINEYKPDVVLVGATSIGRDLAPRISARLRTGLTADCTTIEMDDEFNLLMTRPAFGGNLFATIICPDHRPQMASVRPGVMTKCEFDADKKGEIVDFEFKFSGNHFNVEVLEEIVEESEKMKIEDANVLVAVGRGYCEDNQIAEAKGLAANLSGMIAASRAVTDKGVIDHQTQVGQTGKTVRPDLYIATGISGAIQHVAGMDQSELIIAINKNPDAPIFDVADLGIIGDANKIIPILNKKLKELKDA